MIVGIDLGTTNSLIGIWKDGEARLIPNALGEHLTPSVVGLNEDGKVLVGRGAQERLMTHPHLTAANFKRFMGTAKTFLLGKKEFRAEELSAMVVKSLIRDAETELGETVKEAVITVPAYFNDVQRKATRAAGQLAGIKVERIINEPTAAALAYGRHMKDEEQQLLVFDLGGGTFDVSILELFDNVMEIHASAGNNFLGGEDFLMVLIDMFLKENELGERELKGLDPILAMRIRSAAERAKRELSTRHETTMAVSWNDRVYEQTLSRHAFEEACRPVLDQLRAPMERALRDAKIPVKELDQIILVGGATKMPKITELIAKLFGRFPTSQLNPEEVVGLGAAVQAGLKERNRDLKEVVLTDVCPFTLGVEISREVRYRNYQSGCFEPVIERNKVVPVSREIHLQTLQDFQKQIQVSVYQGESRQVKDNIHLGSLTVPVPQRPAGQESIKVRFTYDINGLLEVEVTVLSTGVTKRTVIEENPGSMSQKEIEQRFKSLSHLKLHPRDQTENQLMLARAERWYQQSLGYEREMVGNYLDLFNHALDSQESEAIEKARAELDKLLSTLDVSPFEE